MMEKLWRDGRSVSRGEEEIRGQISNDERNIDVAIWILIINGYHNVFGYQAPQQPSSEPFRFLGLVNFRIVLFLEK